jgi:hypothetical protein
MIRNYLVDRTPKFQQAEIVYIVERHDKEGVGRCLNR